MTPFLNPSMSPIHPLVWLFALVFQLSNGTSIGCWLAGYGPTTRAEWQKEANYKSGGRMALGIMIWALGFALNVWHDDELREIRRSAARNQRKQAAEAGPSTGKGKGKGGEKSVDKIYMIPQNGLFTWILYPHYLCEWIEWGGFWMAGGWNCVPARNFLVNEIAAMLPRAVSGKKWYIDRFGKEKVGNKKAIIPGIL
jgi:3-oxo-5-alpha-steroid 4-dehydrogenase 1